MKDLMTAYAEAKFGKHAAALAEPEKKPKEVRPGLRKFVRGYFPTTDEQLTERLRAIRDAIEESIRTEERLRQKALEAAGYAGHKTRTARPGGPIGWGWDIVRAAVPGLSPAAAKDDGIDKEAQPPESAEYPSESRWYPAIHLGMGVTGAGLGAAHALRGLTEAGRLSAAKRLLSAAPVQRGVKPEELLKSIARLAGRDPETLTAGAVEKAIATARGAPLLTRLKRLVTSPRLAWKQMRGKLPTIRPPAARVELGQRALQHLREGVKLPWKRTAIAGAAIATALPFLINLWRNRAIRAKGGPEATRAARKAQYWLDQAERIGKWRRQQLSQMELAGEPSGYQLLPFTG